MNKYRMISVNKSFTKMPYRTLVRKIWDVCLEYEYVSESYNFMGFFVDKVILK